MTFINVYELNESGNVVNTLFINVNSIMSLQKSDDNTATIRFTTGEVGKTQESYQYCKNVLTREQSSVSSISFTMVSDR